MGRAGLGAGVTLLALFAGIACARRSDAGGSGDVGPMPDDFAVAVGAGGGFTGSWSETSCGADGVVRTRSGGPDDGSATVVGCLGEDVRREIWRELHLRGFFAMPNEPGNMSTAITVTASGSTTSVARAVGEAPADFERLARFVTSRLDAARHAATGSAEPR